MFDHVKFGVRNYAASKAFFLRALEAGGRDNGAPRLRPQCHADYHAVFVIDPDGHDVEAVCHEPEA